MKKPVIWTTVLIITGITACGQRNNGYKPEGSNTAPDSTSIYKQEKNENVNQTGNQNLNSDSLKK